MRFGGLSIFRETLENDMGMCNNFIEICIIKKNMEINELGMPIDKDCDASANQQK